MMHDTLLAELARQHRQDCMRKAEAWRRGESAAGQQRSAPARRQAPEPWRALCSALAALRPGISQ